MQLIMKMNHVTLFREVTEAHILAYRYRTDVDIYGDYSPYEQENESTPLEQFLNKNMLTIISGFKVSLA